MMKQIFFCVSLFLMGCAEVSDRCDSSYDLVPRSFTISVGSGRLSDFGFPEAATSMTAQLIASGNIEFSYFVDGDPRSETLNVELP